MSHKHWPKDHPRYASAPTCELSTKKLCNERYARWKAQRKMDYETIQAERLAIKREAGEVAYQRFIALEAIRIAAILSVGAGGESDPA